jgi:mannose-6-phosphate isomerase-like protein (cupin superfamily)
VRARERGFDEPSGGKYASAMTNEASTFTITNLTALEDVAAKHGFSETHEARFANQDLDARETGLSHQRLKPNKRQPFGHRHDEAEEVYLVLAGSGRVKLDDEIVEISELDAIRVAPGVTRAFEADGDGLEYVAFGARHEGDAEVVPGWWAD